MVARFTDHKALAFAYSDLLAAGVPPAAMSASRYGAPPASRAARASLGVLAGFHQWLRSQRTRLQLRGSSVQHPPFHLPDAHWPALQINAPGREDTVFGVVAHRQGTLIL